MTVDKQIPKEKWKSLCHELLEAGGSLGVITGPGILGLLAHLPMKGMMIFSHSYQPSCVSRDS